MAKLKFVKDGVELEVPAGTPLKQVIEENNDKINIHFACADGRCGTCLIRILKGMENLNERTENEKTTLELLGAEDNQRLACQTIVEKDGEVEIENVY